MTTTGLVRVTVAAPHRRIDLALPEQSPVAELLPVLLRHAGEGLADDGATGSGWVLHRADGSALEHGRPLGTQRVRDGEILHLVPRRVHWPELEYDDVVDAIASGAGRTGRLWTPVDTRGAGLAAGAVTVALALVAILSAGPGWTAPGWAALALAALLLAAGTGLARAVGDAGAGAVAAAVAMPCAFAGGALLFGGDLALTSFGAAQLLGGCAALVLTAVAGLLAVVERAALFVAGAVTGLLGALGAWAVTGGLTDGRGAAAVLAGAALVFSPTLGPLAIRLGRLPMPVLPHSAADLVRDDPQPPRRAVYAAVLRADGLLTGLLAGSAFVAACAQVLLSAAGDVSAIVLLFVLSAGFCVRARLYPALRQRVPVLAAGLTGAAGLATGALMAEQSRLLVVAVPVLIALAAAIAALGLVHSRRRPSAYLGRYAELFEIVLVLACVPVVCSVLGLYGLVRGLGG
ncbi:type VII secretion integral membrane protein EccD [Prauserella cavernicola]|uniref:Type VII secretion integral membrane protein EccD n=1 Tax=Prauserella cavernicola TaxID=2800127 RepID=A0A934V7Y4_9PSEU|nr:type VII secretion integral membrane protein EccD [Prauserella cavernicola]MBK1789087.1 type VII secretion integral membrane protein EccD [Prauserella cavernicola]